MGTNYYLEKSKPEPEGLESQRLHIGKSSGGWCFALHVIPEEGLNSLADWVARWSAGGRIVDEYDRGLTGDEMFLVITARSWKPADQIPEWYRVNYAEPGPNGLTRAAIGDPARCVGHGEGTWDLITGEFS